MILCTTFLGNLFILALRTRQHQQILLSQPSFAPNPGGPPQHMPPLSGPAAK